MMEREKSREHRIYSVASSVTVVSSRIASDDARSNSLFNLPRRASSLLARVTSARRVRETKPPGGESARERANIPVLLRAREGTWRASSFIETFL